MKKIVLIDSLAIAYKAYFAFISRPLRNSKGMNVGAIYGFLSFLLNIYQNEKPDQLIAAFDSKEKTFRHEKYSEYKANREEMPEELILQIDEIKKLLSLLRIPILALPGYEADDIIGTLSKKLNYDNNSIFLVTPDKDYLQLLDDNVYIIRPGKKSSDAPELIKKEDVKTLLGIEKKELLDYFALVGDSSDNIPGVKGIGEKTALQLINEFHSIENIYTSIEKLKKDSIKEKLLSGKEKAFLSKYLVTIDTNVPIILNKDILISESPDLNKLRQKLSELEIKAFNAKIDQIFNRAESLFESANVENTPVIEEKMGVKNKFQPDLVNYQLINDIDQLENVIADITKSGYFVIDTETDDLFALDANIIGISLCYSQGLAWFIDFRKFSAKEQARILELINKITSEPEILKIGQNIKYDINVLKKYSVYFIGKLFDTMVASYILRPDRKHNMDDLALEILDYDTIKISELIGKSKDAKLMISVNEEMLRDYACEDADITFRLYQKFNEELCKNELHTLCEKIEFPLIKVLSDMEETGVFINNEELELQSGNIENNLKQLENDIYSLSGELFNINSPKQLQDILFNKLKLPPQKKTASGFSTDIQTLEQLKYEHNIIEKLIDYRQYSKLKSTYIDALPKLINKKSGRIHTSYNQTVALTGRLSSTNPNLQNIPIRTELGREIRKAFTSQGEDFLILSADYSQIELRLMAHLCQDENMLKAFKENVDIHSNTASLVYGCKLEEVTTDMRRKAKEVNFGIIYGIGPHGLKTRLGISQNQAKDIITNYFISYPGIKNYLDSTIKFAKENGYVETLMKRRRYLPNINSKNFTVRSFEERAAINMPIQGTASDMIKIAMINIHNKLIDKGLKTKLIMQVHDELLFEVPKDEIDIISQLVKSEMEAAMTLSVNIRADVGIGVNWLDAH